MARKRKAKGRARRSKPSRARTAKRTSQRDQKATKGFRALRIADVLISIAVAFTLINAVLVLIFPGLAIEAAANYGYNTTTSSWISLAVAWIFLVLFIHWTNKTIKATSSRRAMWGLFILGLLLGVTTRIESAVLVLAASLTYLVKTRKRR